MTWLPPEITVDPQQLSAEQRAAAGVIQLSARQPDAIAALNDSERMRWILGDDVVDATIAVRRYETENYSNLDPEQLTDRFRLAWSL